MASVHRRNRSPYWWAKFKLADGRRAFRSTKEKSRAKAMRIAMEWERAAESRATEVQIRKVFSDIHNLIHGRPLASSSVKDYVTAWLADKTAVTKPATIAAYSRATSDFLAALGDRQHADIASVTRADITSVRNSWAASGAPKTTNNKLKALRVMFQSAWRDGMILENPAAKVEVLKNTDTERRAFTPEELKKVLGAADGEWRGMILAGLYTGQRLSDLARLRWNQVDLVKRDITLTTAKTGRTVIVPIAEPLFVWLTENAGDDATGPVFPTLAGKLERGGSSPLSQEFYSVLVSAGLATERAAKDKPTGNGRRAPRVRNELTFHTLRHTATSLLKKAGVSEAVARDIIGHDSVDVSRHYTHTTTEDKRAAVQKLPDLTAK